MKRFALLMGLALLAAAPAPAAANTKGDHAHARKVVLAYSAALARHDWRATCHYLAGATRKHLIETAQDRGLGSQKCTSAARRVLNRKFARVTILKVTDRDPVDVRVRFADSPKDSGDYQADADVYTGVLHVYNVYLTPPFD